LPIAASPRLEPRKSPVQARSTASVQAILDATIQVLLTIGKDRLTTTRVAHRAGVSVGTLYQYFPNKSALVQAALSRHLTGIVEAVEQACAAHHHQPLSIMAATLVDAFFHAKTRNLKTSVALYQVSSDVDGLRISRQIGNRAIKAIAAMLATAPQPVPDPDLAANVLMGAMAGITRRILESPAPEKHLPATHREMVTMASAYLTTTAAVPSPSVPIPSPSLRTN
jgi:AcrR family transcriptional regulator